VVALTDDLEMNVLTDVGRGGYLAFVDTRVSDLRILDLERPVFTGWLIDRPETLVAGISVPADGQQVNVSVSDPGDLERQKEIKKISGVA